MTNTSIGGGPIEDEVKARRISYEWAGKTYEVAELSKSEGTNGQGKFGKIQIG